MKRLIFPKVHMKLVMRGFHIRGFNTISDSETKEIKSKPLRHTVGTITKHGLGWVGLGWVEWSSLSS